MLSSQAGGAWPAPGWGELCPQAGDTSIQRRIKHPYLRFITRFHQCPPRKEGTMPIIHLNSADQGIGFLISSRTLSKAYSSLFVTLEDRYYQKSIAVDYVPDYIFPHLAELRYSIPDGLVIK
jgi:hypothetical protein